MNLSVAEAMNNEREKSGFSLIEILLAVSTLGIGLLFISGTFLTGIYFSTIATEQTTAAVAADEAFAKIMLYDINPTNLTADQSTSFEELSSIDPNEFAYPSTDIEASQKQYYWSALCRRAGSDPNNRLVQITVFVSRKAGSATSYRGEKGRPVPMQVGISAVTGENSLTVTESDKITWINDGYTIVDDKTGQIYRVLERNADQPNTIRLDRPWQGGSVGSVWVVPPPTGGGKKPTITIYQKVIRF
jgi:type II secretory pathway pseudopilin PulG